MDKMSDEPRMISVEEAAREKGCSRQSIHSAMKSSPAKIRGRQFGRLWLVICDGAYDEWAPNPNKQAVGRARWGLEPEPATAE